MLTPFVIYLIKANLALALLYCLYKLLFRNDTFFGLRRLTLLLFLVFPLLYQLPDLSLWLSSKPNLQEVVYYYSGLILPDVEIGIEAAPTTSSWKLLLPSLLYGIYLLGVGVLVVRLIIQFASLIHKRMCGRIIQLDHHKVCILSGEKTAFSFFGWIFISEEQRRDPSLQEVLLHEATHASELHSLDLLLAELTCIVCWFNPFVWLLQKEIRINQEFIADRQVLCAGCDKKSYQYALIGMRNPHTPAIASLYNHFSVLLLKKRISMLNQKRTRSIGKAKYLMLIPIFAAFLIFNNIDAMARITENATPMQKTIAEATFEQALEQPAIVPQSPQDTTVFTVVEQMPEFPGGQNALLEYLAQNIKYPEVAHENGIQGRVIVNFIVNQDGSISDAGITRGVDPALDKEAIRIIESMPNWKPGTQRGKAVRVKYTLPITFRLS